ncbi:MAG: GH3 auxin-responsive promoter family protein [Chloroflexi bacterium]|nr:GH3 auxin-responsive promoter family protein [Chloroflexota bacterium]
MKADRAQWDRATAWRRYCGFLDISMETFMEIQTHLLTEQLELIGGSRLGRRIMRAERPTTVEEFRSSVPLTTYGDYLPFLDHENPTGLPEGEYSWVHTSGARAGHKWVPYTRRAYNRFLDNTMAAFILAGARHKGDVVVQPGDVVMFNMPPRPYLSGLATFGMQERFAFKGVIDPAEVEMMEFGDKVRLGFERALATKVDVIISMTSVLVRTGQAFESSQKAGGKRRSSGVKRNGRAMRRMLWAKLVSMIGRRPIRPRDLWPTKALISWGIDTDFYRERVREYWGRLPYEMYGCTEGGVMGMQSWERGGFLFSPYADFFEFIPEEASRGRFTGQQQPDTVLLPEVEPGKTYELVITNFYGMPLLRYRVGHMVRFREMPEGGWAHGPEFDFIGRGDDRVDISGFTRIDEKSVWDAMRDAGIEFDDWAIRKENVGDKQFLHLYGETDGRVDADEAAKRLHQTLTGVDQFYRDLETMLEIAPMQVTTLPPGTFDLYYNEKLAQGQPLDLRRPPRMNADDGSIDDLMRLASTVEAGATQT